MSLGGARRSGRTQAVDRALILGMGHLIVSDRPAEDPMQDEAQPTLDFDAPSISSLKELAKAEQECTRCPLYKDATQAVPGEGRKHSRLMLVGEQPGDKEDLAGKPFVGPAGRILDSALAAAGSAGEDAFVTNAVKHFT